MNIFLVQKHRIGKHPKCSTEDDLLFPLVKYIGEDNSPIDKYLDARTFLHVESLLSKDCTTYACQKGKCKIKTKFHSKFIELGLAGCYRCDKMENIVKRILNARGYIFIEMHERQGHKYVKFLCDKYHLFSIKYEDIRLGKGCIDCHAEEKKSKSAKQTRKAIFDLRRREECDCEDPRPAPSNSRFVKEFICQHYNFAVIFPEAAASWDFVLNDLLPTEIHPRTESKYWFRCTVYNELYEQSMLVISRGSGCPYCTNKKVCLGNSLLSTHSLLCQDWDFDENYKYPTEVTAGMPEIVSWICKYKEEHPYKQTISARAIKKIDCYCKNKARSQQKGGHEYFVAMANDIHNNKYLYPEPYINSKTKMNIYCPVIDVKTSIVHGIFSQTPSDHKRNGICPKCATERSISRGMVRLKSYLDNLGYVENTDYFCEQKLPGLVYIKELRIDIYLKIGDVKIAIEYDGEFHFVPKEEWGGIDKVLKNKERDVCKDLYCMKNNISMIRIPYTKEIPQEYLKRLIEYCQYKQMYVSYPHLIDKLKEKFDLTAVEVLIMDTF